MTAQLVEETTVLTLVAPELQQKVEQFYYYEAELLDEWKFRDWYDLFTDDTHYRLPVRRNRLRRQRFTDEAAPRGIEMAHFDADKETLGIYVKQRESGTNWAEDPYSRTRHVISNVRIRPSAERSRAATTSGPTSSSTATGWRPRSTCGRGSASTGCGRSADFTASPTG